MHGSRTRNSDDVQAALGSKKISITVHDEEQQCLGMYMRYKGTSSASGCTEWYRDTNNSALIYMRAPTLAKQGAFYFYLADIIHVNTCLSLFWVWLIFSTH